MESGPPAELLAPARRVPKPVATAIKVALALALLVALFYYGSIDLGALHGLTRAPGAVAVAALLVLLTLPLAALRWSIILRILGLPLPLMSLLHVQCIATVTSQFLLGTASADAVRGVYAWRALRGHTPRIAVSLLADRGLSLAAMMSLALLFMLLRLDRMLAVAPLTALLLSVALALGALAVGALALLLAPGALAWAEALAAGRPRVAALLSQAGAVLLAFRRNLPAALAAGAVALTAAAVSILAVAVLALSLQIGPLSALDYLVATPLALLANALPLTPGGLGVGEVAFDQICGWLDAARSGAGYAGIFFAFRAVSLVVLPVGLLSFIVHRADAVETSTN
jgi:glycosyltransferase 2 family protein